MAYYHTGFGLHDGYDIPNYTFELDWEMLKYLNDELAPITNKSVRIKEKEGWSFFLGIYFGKEVIDMPIIKGPSISRRDKIYDWIMWMPSYKIIESHNPLKTFLDYFFDAILLFMEEEFGISSVEIAVIKEKIYKRFLQGYQS